MLNFKVIYFFKVVGELFLFLVMFVLFVIKDVIKVVRKDSGYNGWFVLDILVMFEWICMVCVDEFMKFFVGLDI